MVWLVYHTCVTGVSYMHEEAYMVVQWERGVLRGEVEKVVN